MDTTNRPNERLRDLIARFERLQRERAAIDDDLATLWQEAKADGFDRKVLKRLLAERAGDPAAKSEEDQLLDTYRTALAGL